MSEYHRHDDGQVVPGPAVRCIDPAAGAHDVLGAKSVTAAEHPATGDEERACDDSPHGASDCGHPENHWPPAIDVDSDNAAAGGAEGLDELDALALAEEIWTEDEPNDAEQLLMQRVLTSDWLAAHVAQAKAEALREAADDLDREPWRRGYPQGWLRDRADRIEGTR